MKLGHQSSDKSVGISVPTHDVRFADMAGHFWFALTCPHPTEEELGTQNPINYRISTTEQATQNYVQFLEFTSTSLLISFVVHVLLYVPKKLTK